MRKNSSVIHRLRSPGIMAAIGLAACTGWAADLITQGMLPLGTDAAPGFLWRTYQVTPLAGGLANVNEQAEAVLAGCFGGTTTGSNVANLVGSDTRGLFRIYRTVNFNKDAGDIGSFTGDVPVPGLPGVTGTGDNEAGECLTYVEFPEAGPYTMGVNSDDGFRVTQGWARPRQALLIKSPASIAGSVGCVPSYPAVGGVFVPLPSTPITAEAVIADPVLAGGALNNAAAVSGKICVVDRGGGIAFAVKVKNAQDAGALAVIVVNENNPTTMPTMMGGDGTGITIPAVMIGKPDGDRIKGAVATGPVTMSLGALDGLELGTFNGGRGAADTTFSFNVPEAGLYPLRLLWYNGGGGANVEWFSIDANGAKVLVNDRSNPTSLRAFQGPVVTNWVAFNDHIAGAGTAANVSGYNLWLGPGGPLTNFADLGYDAGHELAVSLGVRSVGGVAVAGTMIPPDAGTPAYELFNGIIDMGPPCYLYSAAGQRTYMTFTGLDPNMFYNLRTTSVRGRDAEDPPNRWSVASLGGAVSFLDASTPGVVTAANLPTSTLTNGQAAWNSGRNRAAGEVVGWDYIVPAADGTLSVVSEIYYGAIPVDPFTAATGPYGYGPECFMLEEVGAPSPLAVVAQPQAEVPGRQGRPFSITVRVSGTTPTYQWYHSGAAIADATLATYAVGHASARDAGNYYLVAANAFGSVTSAVAHVVVEIDAVPPYVSAASCRSSFDASTQEATLNTVIVEFSETMDAATLSDPGAYTLLGPDGSTAIAISALTVLDGTTVALTTDPQTPNTKYTVSSTAIDLAGNPCDGKNKVPFLSWVSSPANGLLFESYLNISGTAVANMTGLTGVFPDHPALVTHIWGFDSRIVYPGDGLEYYGARMSGLFFPPRSGNWRFYIRSDDASQLFLNPNGTEAAGKQLILEETGCCGDWNKYESETYTLQVGKGYYLELLYKEGGGGDYGKVAARVDGTGRPPAGVANTAIDPNALAGPDLGWPYAPADAGGPIVITQAPADVTVEEDNLVALKVVASNASGLPLFYQWRSNGVDIADATVAAYSFPAPISANGAVYSVQIVKIGSVVIREAKVTVVADTHPPQVVGIRSTVNLSEIKISFSEFLDPASVDAARYTVTDPASGTSYDVTAAVLDATGTNVTLTVSPLLALGTTFAVNVKYATDLSGNALVPVVRQFSSWILSHGLLRFDYFSGLNTTDNSLDSTLLADPRFPDRPTASYYAGALNDRLIFADTAHEGYGWHVTGYFIPPEDGNYIFYLRSDDSSRLFLNPDGMDPAGKEQIVQETGCCGAFSKLPSAPQTLTAGQAYYLEALMKEGTGGDYLQVAVKLDTDPTSPDSLSPIPGSMLATLVDPTGASVTITGQPQDLTVIKHPPPVVPPLLAINFAEGDGGCTVSNMVRSDFSTPPGPWIYDEAAGSWTSHGQDACISPQASMLIVPDVTVDSAGKVFLKFSHRYSFEFGSDGVYYDGGQVRYSVNGGLYTNIQPSQFSANGYNVAKIGGNGLIRDQPAFGSQSLGYGALQYLNTVAELGTFNAGDVISVMFLGNWDECSQGALPNWEIKTLEISSVVDIPAMASFSVSATSEVGGLPNTAYFYQWQRDDGAGFVNILEVYSATNTFEATLEDSGAKFRVLVYVPGAVATSQVAVLKVLRPEDIVSLTITADSTGVTVSWPLASTGFTLEAKSDLSSPTWTAVPANTYKTTATTTYIKVPAPITGSKFYRLRK